MKTILTAAALAAMTALPVSAGNLSDPIVDRDVILADTTATSSSAGVALVLLVTAVIVAAAAD